ncbi:MAG: Hpt domain-containing protein [Planctomycetes bacterium]|nr:Hpt domain-containing protein [Planctomycetota bacterium]
MSNALIDTVKKENQALATKDVIDESMAVRLSCLDNMLDLAGEVIIVSSNLNAISHDIREGTTISKDVSEDIKDLAITSTRISSDLHSLVSNVRTVTLSDLFARFRRLARDTSRRLGKAIRFEVKGEDICIDKKISEKIYDPIAHQIRNAIAHGIENEQSRVSAGKDPVGNISVRVRNLETSTIIDVTDDGGGIEEQKIRERIVEMGLKDADSANRLDIKELYEYLYLPGFSTSSQTSSTAGRGVGMDVIRTTLNEIGGETKIESKVSEGTTFSFILPNVTAVNISDCLLVRANHTIFTFPILSVVASHLVPIDKVTNTTNKGRSIIYLGRILPLFDLMEILGQEPVKTEGDQLRVLIIEYKQSCVAYIVSDYLNPQKIVITEFSENMKVPGLLGTAILSGRQMGLVIDLPKLFEITVGSKKLDTTKLLPTLEVAQELPESGEEISESANEIPNADIVPEAIPEGLEIEKPDSAFLVEVKTMLSQLNRQLLSLDEKRDNETADAVFRLMHSIKGNLTMCGAEKSSHVAHQLETLLEQARRNELELTDNIFDILFDGSAYLEGSVEALKSGKPQTASSDNILEQINKIFETGKEAEGQAQAVDMDIAHIPLDPMGEFYLSSRRREGANLYRCRVDFEPGDQPGFLVAYLILRRIQRVGDVIGTLPSIADIESELCENSVFVLFAQRDPRSDLIENLGNNLKRYYGVTHFDASTYA